MKSAEKILDEIIWVLTGVADHKNPQLCSIALNNLQIRREAEKELTEKNLPSLELIDKINQLIKEYYRDQE